MENIKDGLQNVPENLKVLQLLIFENYFGGNVMFLELLLDGLKLQPESLKKLTLDCSQNSLGDQDFKFFGENMKQISQNLKIFSLLLIENNMENMKYIREGLKYLLNTLEQIYLNLAQQNIGKEEKNTYYLGDFMNQLPSDLEYLKQDLQDMNLGTNTQNMLDPDSNQLPPYHIKTFQRQYF